MIPYWIWVIVTIVIFLILITITFLIWKKKKKSIKDEEKPFPSPTPTIEPDTELKPETIILHGQQFTLIEPSQTALSPPPQRERKISTIVLNEEELPIQKTRKVFSLSPHQETDSIQDSTISNTTTRTITPFQGHTGWRGPTPPWTQT